MYFIEIELDSLKYFDTEDTSYNYNITFHGFSVLHLSPGGAASAWKCPNTVSIVFSSRFTAPTPAWAGRRGSWAVRANLSRLESGYLGSTYGHTKLS